MGLRNLPIPHRTVEVAEGASFTVRGFSPNDALGIYHRHAGGLSALFDEFAAKARSTKGKIDDIAEAKRLGTGLVTGAPRIMAEIIAVASGSTPPDPMLQNQDPEKYAELEAEFEADVRAALNLSAGVQMDALQKVGDLTFTSEMPPGKFLAVVVKLAGSATAAMTKTPTA